MSGGETLMRDVFTYELPLGWLGMIADWLFLKSYMTSLLRRRNTLIKEVAEEPSAA
jgi:ligand-binding SRPBCC domain-containing protein